MLEPSAAPAAGASEFSPGAASLLRAMGVVVGPSAVLDLSLAAGAAGAAAWAMSARARRRRWPAISGALGTAAWGYALFARPWMKRWGATEEEVRSALPGDELVPRPVIESTRAIEIHAAAEDVWPWLVQIGYRRAGWYSYDLLEKLAGAGDFVDGGSADRIIPELQHVDPGLQILIGPGMGFDVHAAEPDTSLVLLSPAPAMRASWAFSLHELEPERTRLRVRFRADFRPRIPGALAWALLLELPHFIMERAMLRGLRDRAERLRRTLH